MSVDLQSVKESVNLQGLVRSVLGPPRKEQHDKAFWLCPFHADDKTPSLVVYRDHYHCYGCGAHGSVIDWTMRMGKVDFKEALTMLGHDAMKLIPPAEREHKPHIKTPPDEEWQDNAMHFATECHAHLFAPETRSVRIKEYLNGQRGISDQALMDNLIGLNPADMKSDWGPNHKVWLPYGITIPLILSDTNQVWAVKIRQRKDREPKYIHVSGSIPGLFGADTILDNRHVFITEGEFDCLVLRQAAGDLAAVVTFGASTAHDLDTWLPYLVKAERIYIVGDNDEAGEKMWEFWAGQTKRARKAFVLVGKDVTEAWQQDFDLTDWVKGVIA